MLFILSRIILSLPVRFFDHVLSVAGGYFLTLLLLGCTAGLIIIVAPNKTPWPARLGRLPGAAAAGLQSPRAGADPAPRRRSRRFQSFVGHVVLQTKA